MDKKTPDDLKAQGQGFIFLVTFGLGLLAGNLIDGQIIHLFTNVSGGIKTYDWNTIWGLTSVFSVILLVLFILFFREDRSDKQAIG